MSRSSLRDPQPAPMAERLSPHVAQARTATAPVLRPRLLDEKTIRRRFGDIMVANEQVVTPARWEARFIVRGEWLGVRVRVHQDLMPYLVRAAELYLASGQAWRPTSAGGFVPRPMRTNPAALSRHSWGIALDVDATQNPLVRAPAGDPRRRPPSFPPAFVGAMRGAGFVWGGDWSTIYDPMHFELGV